MDFIRDVLGSTTTLSPFGFALRSVLVGFLLWAEGKFLPHRSGGQFAGYDFAFFWMMGGVTAAPLFEPKLISKYCDNHHNCLPDALPGIIPGS